MFQEFDIWKLLAGLGIFMFGMFLMEESIKKLSGRAFKGLIRRFTTGKVKSIFSGAFVTSILQSSSAVSLMVLAFVGAGIMTMENAIGVILGSNIGTTITAWIVATIGFKMAIESFALPLIGSGGLGIMFLGKSEKYSNISKLLVGFGFLFMGLDYMKSSVEVLANSIDIGSLPDYGILVFVGVGIVLTAVMQSSSATIAIVLTALNSRIIEFDSAAAVVIGSNVGTTVTILLGAIGAVQVKKRVAYSHFAFNLITGIIALALMPAITYLILQVFSAKGNEVIGLALFHTIFNLLGVLVFYPFIHPFANLLTKVFPDRRTALTRFINNTTTDVAEAGISAMRKETLHLVKNVLRHNLNILHIDERLVFSNYDYSNIEKQNAESAYNKEYENLKLLQAEIFTFSSGIQERELTKEEALELNRYMHGARMALHSAKMLKDINHNFDEFENANNAFLNNQYTHFRKRLIETYLEIDKLIDESDEDKPNTILKTLAHLKKDDNQFVSLITHAIKTKQIDDIDISTALIVNRAFVQSSRQLLLTLKELLLTSEEVANFEKVQEMNDALLEIN
jgi:phosphate:Na+ symporter